MKIAFGIFSMAKENKRQTLVGQQAARDKEKIQVVKKKTLYHNQNSRVNNYEGEGRVDVSPQNRIGNLNFRCTP